MSAADGAGSGADRQAMGGVGGDKPLTGRFRADGSPLSLEDYLAAGGYSALRRALTGMTPHDVVQEVLDSGLEGRGGAGFSTGRKWSFVPADTLLPRFLVANADETEPGAFKDRVLMEGDPHLLLEGMALAAYATGAGVAYLFIRSEYRRAAEIMRVAIEEARAAHFLGRNILGSSFDLDLRLHVSAGRYICGEASAMLNALEGERPIPRHKPPHQTSSGLWSKPTVVNNVETLCSVPAIVERGAAWYKSLGVDGRAGTKLYTVSGRVRNPGAWELPLGTSIQTLLEQRAGGMRPGLNAVGVLPGGASTRFVLARDFATPLDEPSLEKVGSRLGTGTMIVLDDQTCPVGMLRNLEAFYGQESCGWCTPCWQGLSWIESLLGTFEEGRATRADLDLLRWHLELIKPEHTFCDLAPGAMEPLGSGLEYFRDAFEAHIEEGRCPWEHTRSRWPAAGRRPEGD